MAEQKESLYAMRRRRIAEGTADAASKQGADIPDTDVVVIVDGGVDKSEVRAAAGEVIELTPDSAGIGASNEMGPEQASEPWRKFYAAVRQATERMRE